MKPADDAVSNYIAECPTDGRPCWLEWWLPFDQAAHEGELQLVAHHGKGHDANVRGYKRNDFHYLEHFRQADDGELRHSFRAWPEHAPLDDRRVRRFLGLKL